MWLGYSSWRRTAGRGALAVHPSRTSPRSFCALPVGAFTTPLLLAVPEAQPDDDGASFLVGIKVLKEQIKLLKKAHTIKRFSRKKTAIFWR